MKKTKFYFNLAIQCDLVREITCELIGNIQTLIPFRNGRSLSVVRASEKKKKEMKKLMGREYTGLYDKLGYEVWDYDEGVLPDGGPVSMSEDMINDLVNSLLKEWGKDISFIIPAKDINYHDNLFGSDNFNSLFEVDEFLS